jgi:hypothetical protein
MNPYLKIKDPDPEGQLIIRRFENRTYTPVPVCAVLHKHLSVRYYS